MKGDIIQTKSELKSISVPNLLLCYVFVIQSRILSSNFSKERQKRDVTYESFRILTVLESLPNLGAAQAKVKRGYPESFSPILDKQEMTRNRKDNNFLNIAFLTTVFQIFLILLLDFKTFLKLFQENRYWRSGES